ncbi:hypothetical protein Pure05_08620 [Paenarthrobacter ureafaciens]|nr:hypothetical protein NicSoilE8_12520 [Arthrobacter sp. NicSoilE8]GLU58008.1 hypothetical protein Pure01_05210 [Paenarthrobacter ureafaciens]GLU62615.1 hypothetical protein Pure02_08650 [Paenarthrobacter ureafaciens]GLU66897.1 hypothetical protein Pure03_08730 [Paenarthrobacter ureafaciens]GLU70801.1 hypothetical protein Pure04_05160 [Paenarthrobacter ureafaciens]
MLPVVDAGWFRRGLHVTVRRRLGIRYFRCEDLFGGSRISRGFHGGTTSRRLRDAGRCVGSALRCQPYGGGEQYARHNGRDAAPTGGGHGGRENGGLHGA